MKLSKQLRVLAVLVVTLCLFWPSLSPEENSFSREQQTSLPNTPPNPNSLLNQIKQKVEESLDRHPVFFEMTSKETIHLINVTRRSAGLPSLKYSRMLTLSAKTYAVYLKRTHTFEHDSYIHASHKFKWLGEVIAKGQKDYKSTVQAWLQSPGHRAILLSLNAKRAGFGQAGDIRVGHFGGR